MPDTNTQIPTVDATEKTCTITDVQRAMKEGFAKGWTDAYGAALKHFEGFLKQAKSEGLQPHEALCTIGDVMVALVKLAQNMPKLEVQVNLAPEAQKVVTP